MEKKCRGCGETKPVDEYHKAKRGKYGRRAKCKECRREDTKAYNQTEAMKAKKKAYNQTEAMKAAKKAYRESEKGRAIEKAYMKVYNQTDARKASMKRYQQSEKGKAAMKAAKKAYRESGKENANRKNRLQTDPVYKLQCRLRSGFCGWIKGNTKTCRTEQYVGCTYNELLDHLESRFEEGMTWENHGEWHIDHFKAQSRFDPTNEEEAYMCWHYTNLQPMWASDNIKYNNKKKPGDENRIWMGREIGWVS